MRLDRLTVKAQEALQAAQSLASDRGHQAIEPEHLLQALIAQKDGTVAPILGKLGVRPETLASQLEAAIEKLPQVRGGSGQYMGEPLRATLERRTQPLAHVLAAAAAHLGDLLERGVHLRAEGVGAYAELAENGRDHAVLLRDQRAQQVLRLDGLVAPLVRERLGRLQRVLSLDRQLVESHRFSLICRRGTFAGLRCPTVGESLRIPVPDGRRIITRNLGVNRSEAPAGARTAPSRLPSARPAS